MFRNNKGDKNMNKDRNHKGKTQIMLPSNYTVIDIETTGFDYNYCDIIEISAIKIRNDLEIDRFTTLVQPPEYIVFDDNENEHKEYVDSFVTELTGITNDMLESAPRPSEIVGDFYKFIENDILVGHNVNFDINFLYDLLESYGFYLKNDFVDTLRISRKLFKEMKHHRLSDIAALYHISVDHAHRALEDCKITNSCYQRMKSDILSKYTEKEFEKLFHHHHSKPLNAKDICSNTEIFDESNPLFGKVVVFTGALSSMPRRNAMQIVANCGGTNANSVTRNTNFLVIGNEEFAASVKNGKTTKMKKAEDLILKGYDIQIVSEDVFLSTIQI